MKQRYLYGDADLIEEMLSSFELIETAAGGFAAVYKEPSARSFWLKYYATAATQGGGYLTLIRLPAPGTEELIDIAISTDYEDEAVAALLRLLDEEAIEQKNFRHTLIKRLEQLMLGREVNTERLIKVIKLSSLDDPTNRRELLEKSNEQIEEDALYFSSIAEKAKNLLSRLQR
ncbi:hypothetical protein H9Q13_06555 [Pontibacter sp. JH31]|uniref:DUF4375 domain-containing protein n=1 Tax=Pontibacter aquaedesilientis TaxID=2766980 RepID=A0ABR7XHD7_9BACT|nr:hypothetical protein [Pontibacter aquaedesilientis]MBD1396821.1 hypothetical protein [Pontibacter aquaedesilientis]